MLPYFLLLLIPSIFCFIAVKKERRKRFTICVGNDEYVSANNLAIPIFFLSLFLMLALRDKTVGRDISSYENMFNSYRGINVRRLLIFEPEALFNLLNRAIGQFTDNFQWFLTIVAGITVAPFLWLYGKYRYNSYISIVLFVNMSTFVMLFSGLRQALAISVGVIAYYFVKKKKPIPFIIAVLVAMGFHHSAFVIALFYPAYHLRLKRRHAIFVIPIYFLFYIFNRQIFNFLLRLFSDYSEEYNQYIESTGAITMLLLFMVFAVYSYFVADESKMTEEDIGQRNFLLVAVFLQSFASLHPLAMRMNYYFIVFIPICIAKILQHPRPEFKEISRWVKIAVAAFFTYYYVSTIYQGYVSGVSTLDTIPYIPFWQ